MPPQRIVAIGASAGGIEALKLVVAGLPRPAIRLARQHHRAQDTLEVEPDSLREAALLPGHFV